MTGFFSHAAPVITVQLLEAVGLVDGCQVCGMSGAVGLDQFEYRIDRRCCCQRSGGDGSSDAAGGN
jgi:hypothetical protein